MTKDLYKLLIRNIDEKYTFFNLYNETNNEDTFRVYFYNDMWDKLDEYIKTSINTASEFNYALLNSRYSPEDEQNDFLNECIRNIAKIKTQKHDIEIIRESVTEQEHIDDPRAVIEVE